MKTLAARPQEGTGFAYFYFDYTHKASLTASALLSALIKQLLPVGQVSTDVKNRSNLLYGQGYRTPTAEELISLLQTVIKLFNRVVLVIDGLDECQSVDQRAVISISKELLRLQSPVVKLFITSRDDADLTRHLDGYPRVRISEGAVGSDIKAFVQHEVRSRLSSGDMPPTDAVLEKEIIATLTEKSQGSFLWVRFQLEELGGALTDHDKRQVLKNLPTDLGETYDRILKKSLSSGARASRSKWIKRIFSWLIVSKRPLLIDELLEAVAIEPGDTTRDKDKIPKCSSTLIQFCGGLVNIDQDDKTTRFAHYTVRQFLLAKPLLGLESARVHPTLEEAELSAGKSV